MSELTEVLRLWGPERHLLTDEIEFYGSELIKRVFRSFDDYESELKKHLEEIDQALSSRLAYDDYEGLMEAQNDAADEFSMRTYDVSREIFLSALAALYFFWDRQLRSFIERQNRQTSTGSIKDIWEGSPNKLLDSLFGKLREGDEFIDYGFLKEIRLKVNVYKHGRGSSLDQLRKNKGVVSTGFAQVIDPNWFDETTISTDEEEFLKLVVCLKNFWSNFPDHCYLDAKP